jgi:5'-3' exonuclease
MGIPSFYRHLVRRYPRLVGGGPGRAAEWLCLDFNCAMYHVLRTQPTWPSTGGVVAQASWEANFREAICAYMRELVSVARPTHGVFVGCDGVVCAAKRRQQRLRRFKGPWISKAEAAVRASAVVSVDAEGEIDTTGAEPGASGSWDSTALTPGTAFMEALGADLQRAGTDITAWTGLEVIVSTTAEPGEGEHKLMSAMRTRKPRSCTIYGLDADLILLALLLDAETGCDVLLMREAQEFENRDAGGGFRHLVISDLGNVLTGVEGSSIGRAGRIRDYIASMTLLGNDFLPRSLTRTVRDDGIPALLDVLRRELWSARRSVVCPTSGLLLREGVATVVRSWAADEETDMLRAVDGALAVRGARGRVPAGKEGDIAEEELANWQVQPSRWCSLGRLKSVKTGGLLPTWRSVMREKWGAGADAGAYLAGLAWVWDYYSGRTPVCQGWVYDRHLPPLWGDVLAGLEASDATKPHLEAPPVRYATGLTPWVHLLSVLPAESVRRLLPVEKQSLLDSAPWYWPSEWSLFDVGRTQMWECEPVLPLIPEATLRRLA